MRVIIEHYSKDLKLGDGGTGASNRRAAAWLAEIKTEHDDYYGTSAGVRKDSGFVSKKEAAVILIKVAVETNGDELLNDVIDALGDDSIPTGGWCTCAGNLTLVCGHIEYRAGRRHGLRHALPCADGDRWTYISTQCPNANPDAYDIDPEEVIDGKQID